MLIRGRNSPSPRLGMTQSSSAAATSVSSAGACSRGFTIGSALTPGRKHAVLAWVSSHHGPNNQEPTPRHERASPTLPRIVGSGIIR